jgi:hypothetical protein
MSVAVTVAFTQHVGWPRFFQQAMEQSPKMLKMPPEQRENMLAMQIKMGPAIGYAGAILGFPIGTLIVAGILLGIFNVMLSAQLKFAQVFAVNCYAGLVGLIKGALTLVVIFLKNPDDFNLKNPLMFNPGAFMDPISSPKFLYLLATSLDLFTFWWIALLAVGLSAAGRKVSFTSALFAVGVPWLLLVLISAGLGAAFS